MFLNSRKSIARRARRGVALLVTIVLLAFLVIIMVAMSSMVRVETQVAANQDAVAQARQNALTGLNVALGKLQETAGPDQRVTARADVLGDAVILPANRRQMNLTGVWDTSGGGAPQLITWLVNGNEDHDTAPPTIAPDSNPFSVADPNARIFDVGNDAAIAHPSTEPLYNDNQPAARLIITGTVAPSFRFGDGRVYLVANGSVDVEPGVTLSSSDSYKYAIEERVLLRKTPIIIDGGKLPGRAAGTDVTVGNYAYWVGDAGIKASLGAANRVPEVAYDDAGNDDTDYLGGSAADDPDYINRKMLNSLQLQGSRLDLVFRPGLRKNNGYLPDIFENGNTPTFLGVSSVDRTAIYGVLAHPLTRDASLRLFFPTQVPQFIHEGPFTQPTLSGVTAVPTTASPLNDFKTVISQRLKQLYHDVTPQTFSVATNMIDGGLRTDISQPDGLAALPIALKPGLEVYTKLWRGPTPHSFSADISTEPGLLRQILNTTSTAQAAVSTTDTAYPIAPVITEFSLTTAASVPAAGGEVQISFVGEIELWNPYNAELRMTNNLSLNITVVDDPDATLSQITARGSGATADHVANYSAANTITGLATLALSTPQPTFTPGQIQRFTFTASSVTAKAPNGSDITAPAGTYEGVDFTVSDRAKLTVELEELGTVISKYDQIDLPAGTPNGSELYYEFRLIDWVNGTNENSWLAFDPRGPSLGTAHVIPGAIGKAARDFGNQIDYYALGQTAVLFDVPRQEVLGVGSLRHIVYRSGARLYAIGSAGGGAANELFERYFFSGIPQNKTVNGWTPLSGAPLANTSTVIVDPTPTGSSSETELWDGDGGMKLIGLTSERSAQYLLIRDTLNVNSTSDIAWRSLLGGALPTLADPGLTGAVGGDFGNEPNSRSHDYVWRSAIAGYPTAVSNVNKDIHDIWANWRFVDAGGQAQTEPVHNVFFRFPHSAVGLRENYATFRDNLAGTSQPKTSFSTRETAAFRLGLRELSRSQIEEMAWWVVEKIKNPGGNPRPFKSVAQFINEGVLDYAIGQVGTGAPPGVNFPAAWTNNDPINNPANRADTLPIGSAAYLTQSDILELIGHRLVARSDTFTIRAYGDVTEPTVFGSSAPKVISRVWVEATVQRMPMKHPTADDPDDNMTPTNVGAPQAGNFGRQFKVISMRWLRPEEI